MRLIDLVFSRELPGKTAARRSRVGRSAFVCILLVGTLSGCAEWVPHWRAFEVTVDLTVEGDRMQITRKILCEGKVRRRAGITPYVQWESTTYAFGEQVPSDGAVMVVTPGLCTKAYREENAASDEIFIPKGHIPFIGWADDADKPNVVEAYVSPGYFQKSSARVRYHGMTARIIDPEAAKPGPVDAFDWFGFGPNLQYGFIAVPVPKSDWEQMPDIKAYVAKNRKFGQLPNQLSLKLWGRSIVRFEYWMVAGTPRPFPPYSVAPITNQQLETLNSFHPLVKGERGLGIQPQESGYLVFYRSDLLNKSNSSDQRFTFVVDDNEISLPATGAGPFAVFDPVSEVVFHINAIAFRFPGKAERTP